MLVILVSLSARNTSFPHGSRTRQIDYFICAANFNFVRVFRLIFIVHEHKMWMELKIQVSGLQLFCSISPLQELCLKVVPHL